MTVRQDQSSRFLKENRNAVFPSVGLSWRASEENFIKSLNFFDSLKLRFAWGRTGNQETPQAYPSYTTFGLNPTTNNYSINGSISDVVAGYAGVTDGNENVTWEKATSIDFGLEMLLFKSRLIFEAGYYDKLATDLLVPVPRAATAGLAETPFINIGEMSNKGFEFLVNWRDNLPNDWSYEIGFNISLNKNEVVKVNDNEASFIVGRDFRGSRITRIFKGLPISYFYGYQVDGFYSTQAEVDALGQSNGAVGGFRYRDIDGDGKITDDDRTIIGSPHPDAIYGINLGLKYKTLSLSVFMEGTQGNEIYDFKKYFTDFHFFPGTVKTTVLNAWTPTNPENAILPQSNDKVTNQEIPNSYYVEDGSYLRVRSIRLSYDLPSRLLKPLRLNRVNVYFQIENALVFTKYSGLDPEVNVLNDTEDNDINFNLGIDRGIYPNPRSFIFGFVVTL